MKKLTLMCVLAVLCLYLHAQQPALKPLSIGDTVPDITLTNVYNYPASTIHLSDLKGKLIIFDFMSTGCVPCIKILPKLDSLQMQYSNHLQIILVSAEKPERIQSFLKRNSYLHIPFIAEDTVLSESFPHEFISHIAWMDEGGIVRAITHSEYINAKNITSLLQGQVVNWPVKRDVTSFDFKQPLLTLNESNIPESSLPSGGFYTAFVNYLPGILRSNDIIIDSINHTVHISMVNRSIIELYLLLYRRFNFPMSHVLLQVKDKGRLVYNPTKGYYEDWVGKNYYCLDAILPDNLPALAQREKLISDCNFYLGLQGKMEKRNVDCLVLRNKESFAKNMKAKGGEGLRIGMITYLLNNKVGAIPVIDETTGTAYTTIPVTRQLLTDNAHLRKILAQYGFELITEKRELEFLVITQP